MAQIKVLYEVTRETRLSDYKGGVQMCMRPAKEGELPPMVMVDGRVVNHRTDPVRTDIPVRDVCLSAIAMLDGKAPAISYPSWSINMQVTDAAMADEFKVATRYAVTFERSQE